jgi:sugar phosphate isomerase/epimerase
MAGLGMAATPAVKFGLREASMKRVGDLAVFEIAASIGGLEGVELQASAGAHNLWSRETLHRYQAEAERWGIRIPSLAGPFSRGVSIRRTPEAEKDLVATIAAAKFLSAAVVLVPFFRENCPPLDDKAAWAPVIAMLRRACNQAADSGVTLALENSLSPAGNAALCDRISHPAVRVYYDLDNCEFYGHQGQAVPGVRTLGLDRIRQVHAKNEDRLLRQEGRVDWKAAFAELSAIGYAGWIVFETRHRDTAGCVSATAENIAFARAALESQ